MVWIRHDYEDIPGTYVFNGERATMGWPLNKMAFSLNTEENREALRQNPRAYCEKFGCSDEQIKAVEDLDFLQMLKLGANIYYLAKLGTAYGLSVQDAGAQMTGLTVEQFKQRLLDNATKG